MQLRRGDDCDDDDDEEEEGEEGGGIVDSGRGKNRPTYISGWMRRNTSTQKRYSTTKKFISNMKFIKNPPTPPPSLSLSLPQLCTSRGMHHNNCNSLSDFSVVLSNSLHNYS